MESDYDEVESYIATKIPYTSIRTSKNVYCKYKKRSSTVDEPSQSQLETSLANLKITAKHQSDVVTLYCYSKHCKDIGKLLLLLIIIYKVI